MSVDALATRVIGASRALARLARHLERSLDPLELSLPQYRLLALLSEGDAAASAVANRLAVSAPSVTSLVDGLVARGLVERQRDPTDRRRQPVAITSEGKKILTAADAATSTRLREIAEHLDSSDPAGELAAFERWHDALDAYREARERTKGR
jgi:long-chain acyl-CoA synthetase